MTKGQRKTKLKRWEKECCGKVKHDTLISAEYYLEKHNATDQHAYVCDFCNKYHVGRFKQSKN